MRLAVSGSHGTGKSTLIAAFLARRPEYLHEPEAYETLGDDVDLASGERPTAEGLQALLEYTARAVSHYPPGARVVFERSPVDYLAYAGRGQAAFVQEQLPTVRAALRHLDLIVLLPVSPAGPIQARPGEDGRFRRRVDRRLRGALLDDDYDLLGGGEAPRVVELSALPERQLAELLRLTAEG
jgi:predicted ATPase